MTFEESWESIVDIGYSSEKELARSAWKASEAAANERIQTLTVENECLSASCKACADQYAAERAISDKLEKALRPIGEYCCDSPSFIVLQLLRTNANLALAEIAAMRKGEK